jgi:hypothetical protein
VSRNIHRPKQILREVQQFDCTMARKIFSICLAIKVKPPPPLEPLSGQESKRCSGLIGTMFCSPLADVYRSPWEEATVAEQENLAAV